MPHTMAGSPGHKDWSNLDQTSDPQWFVKFLDSTRGRMTALIEQDPHRYFNFLEPKAGKRILDVGTGTGVLVHALARIVQPGGQVLGIDLSQIMIDEASKRGADVSGLSFEKMDAMSMNFEDDQFDGAMSSIVFQHLPDPTRALEEMIRVTKRGGIISIIEQDWETFVIDCGDSSVTRRMMNHFSDNVANGWIGRELFRLFCGAGLCNVHIVPANHVLCGDSANSLAPIFYKMLERSEEEDVITADEREAWQMEFETRMEAKTLFAGFTLFRAIGRKPNGPC